MSERKKNNKKGSIMNSKQVVTNQMGKDGGKCRLSNRESPSQCDDFNKSDKIKSKKFPKPEQNQIRLENFKNPHKGVG